MNGRIAPTIIRSALCVACASLALAAPVCPRASAQKTPGRVGDDKPRPTGPTTKVVTTPVTGAVVVVSGVARARIELFIVERNGRALLKSAQEADAKGNATFSSLKPGAYRVVVSHPEYDDARDEGRVVAGKALTLTAKPVPRFGHLVFAGPDLTDDAVIAVDGKTIDASQLARAADGSYRMKATVGHHEVRITRPGFEPFVREAQVVPGSETTVGVAMEREWASVIVRGTEGTRVFLNRKNGEPIESAGVIPSTGEFEISHLTPEQSYDLRFELDDHQPLTRTVRAEAKTKAVVDASLEPLPTNGPFEDTFVSGLSHWEAPSTWTAAGGVLTIRGPGLGIAQDSRYRDFDMSFAIRLTDPRGAAWAVRVRDDKNYYLFVLGGPEGRYPNQLRTYVVRAGAFDAEAPANAAKVVPALGLAETYRVRIHAEGRVIQTWLTPESTGQEVSIALYDDVKQTFSLGQIGFAAPFGESFQVSYLTARPSQSK
jgi:hypothetical protein